MSNSTSADLTTTCFTCEPLEKYIDLTTGFANELSSALSDPMLILFTALFGLWAVVSGYKLAFRQFDINAVVKDLIYITITGVILASQANGLISYVYSTALSVMGGASDTAFSVAGGGTQSTGYTGLVHLAASGELAVAKVIQAALAISKAGRLYDIAKYVYAIVLVVPYFLLVVVYSAQVVVAIFRAMMVAIFAPFLFMAFAFNWGRQMAFAGAKTLLASTLVLFACTAALALTIYGVDQIDLAPQSLTGSALDTFASISNPQFLVILFLGWMGTALMTEGTAIANSIAQTALTNTAAGIMTAGAAGTAMAIGRFSNPLTAGRRAMRGLEGAGEELGAWAAPVRGANQAVVKGAQALVEKFRNINKPGGGEA